MTLPANHRDQFTPYDSIRRAKQKCNNKKVKQSENKKKLRPYQFSPIVFLQSRLVYRKAGLQVLSLILKLAQVIESFR